MVFRAQLGYPQITLLEDPDRAGSAKIRIEPDADLQQRILAQDPCSRSTCSASERPGGPAPENDSAAWTTTRAALPRRSDADADAFRQ